MKRTLIVLSLVLVFCLAGLGTAFADEGTYHGDNKATIIENGAAVEYNTVSLDGVSCSDNTKIQTKESITAPKGVVEYVVDKWQKDIDKNPTEYAKLQNGVLSISDSSSETETFSNIYKVKKTYESEKIVTMEERDGLSWTVTKWTTYVDEFTFRMADTSLEEGQANLLLFLVSSSEFKNEELAQANTLNHPENEVSDIPLIEPNEDPITSEDEIVGNVANPESSSEIEVFDTPHVTVNSKTGSASSALIGDVVVSAATMKKSGLPIIPALLIILLTGLSAIGIRRINKLNKTQ